MFRKLREKAKEFIKQIGTVIETSADAAEEFLDIDGFDCDFD